MKLKDNNRCSTGVKQASPENVYVHSGDPDDRMFIVFKIK